MESNLAHPTIFSKDIPSLQPGSPGKFPSQGG